MKIGNVLYMQGKVSIPDGMLEVLEELDCMVNMTQSIEDAIRLVEKQQMDLIIFNVEKDQGDNIIDFAQSLKEEDVPIIFLSSNNSRNIYEKAKQDNLIAYLISPLDLLTLRSIVEYSLNLSKKKIEPKVKETNKFIDNTFFIKVNQLLHKVYIEQITHVQSEGNYCLIFTYEKKYAIKLSMVRLYQMLSQKGFLQIHKSYLAQLKKIDNIDISSNEVLIGDLRIPLGRKYKQELLACLNLL